MASVAQKKKAPAAQQQLSVEEIQVTYSRLQSEIQTLAQKIGELESESEEHGQVLLTLEECLESEPDRTCFRLIGGVLVERTVKEVAPQIKTNRDGIKRVLDALVGQYKSKEEEFQNFQREHNIRVSRS